MRYLRKQTNTQLVTLELSYDRVSQRRQIRDLLLEEQNRFCAYSERYIQYTDSCDIEHFDPRLKSTSRDDYWNWYAVLSWVNSHKPKKIDPYLPLPNPFDPSLPDRIRFSGGVFEEVNESDVEAKNLIQYLRWNHESLVKDRLAHLERLRLIRDAFANVEEFIDFIQQDPANVSFVTAIEVEFGIALE